MKRPKVSKKILFGLIKKGIVPAFVFAVLSAIFSFKFKTVPDGYSVQESIYIASHDSLKELVNQGINLPINIFSWLTIKIVGTPESFRIFGGVVLAVVVMSMFYAIRKWHNIRIALLTTTLFAINSVVLSSVRSANDVSFMMLWFCFVAFVLWARYSRSTRVLPLILSIATVLVLYLPGAFWFMSVLAILYRKRLREILRGIKHKYLGIGIAVSLIALSPLILAIVKDLSTLRSLLLIPSSIDFGSVLVNIARLPSAFIYKMPDNPALTVGRLPVLDIVTASFAILGLYNYRSYLKWDRTGLLVITALVALCLSALGNLEYLIALSTPFVFMLTASGIAYLLEIWYDVFPRNPIARTFGTITISLLVVISGYYHITRFLVVWPQVPATRATFTEKL